jgi:hypothetical protein
MHRHQDLGESIHNIHKMAATNPMTASQRYERQSATEQTNVSVHAPSMAYMVTGFGSSKGPGEIQQSRANTAKQRITVISAVLRMRRALGGIKSNDASLERSATGASHPERPHRHSACRLAPVR